LIFIRFFFVKRDVEALQNLFVSLNIKTEVHQDLTYTQIWGQAAKLSYDNEFRHASMSIFVLMAHGHDGELFTVDGKPIKTEDIIDLFDDRNCPNLKGKPKWFIFQVK